MSGLEDLNLNQTVVSSSLGRNCRRNRRETQTTPDEPLRRQMCNRCPSCIPIRNISEYSSERTPLLAGSISLLRDSRCYDKVLIYLFMSVLVFGVCISTYLLIAQGRRAFIEEFDYVFRENWIVNSTFLKDIPPLQKPASKILLLQLTPNCTDGTKNCLNYKEFSKNKEEQLRISSGEVLYNFYQDKYERIFEGRGWNFQSECGIKGGCDDVLTIAFIEDSSSPQPASNYLQKLKAFLDYCVMDYALKQCYKILVRHSLNREFEDLAFSLERMNEQDEKIYLNSHCHHF